MAEIVYQSIAPNDYEAVREFLAANGWARRVADGEKFALMMTNADRAVIAVADGRVVGFARALCDGVSNGYLGTVVVAPDFRGRGVGRAIIERLTGDNPEITWVMRAGHESRAFWEKMGFRASEIAMERTRK